MKKFLWWLIGVVSLPIIFIILMISINNIKSSTFIDKATQVMNNISNNEDISVLYTEERYGNYFGNGNGCTIVMYSFISGNILEKNLLSILNEQNTTDFAFQDIVMYDQESQDGYYFQGYDLEHNNTTNIAFELNLEEQIEFLLTSHKRIYLFVISYEWNDFWSTWDPRCQ